MFKHNRNSSRKFRWRKVCTRLESKFVRKLFGNLNRLRPKKKTSNLGHRRLQKNCWREDVTKKLQLFNEILVSSLSSFVNITQGNLVTQFVDCLPRINLLVRFFPAKKTKKARRRGWARDNSKAIIISRKWTESSRSAEASGIWIAKANLFPVFTPHL